MGFLNDVLENAKYVVTKVGNKASGTYDIAKLKAIKAKLEYEIEKRYKVLGNKYYKLSKVNAFTQDTVKAEIREIDELVEHRERIIKQICEARNLKHCPSCGKYQNTDKPFCADCGHKF